MTLYGELAYGARTSGEQKKRYINRPHNLLKKAELDLIFLKNTWGPSFMIFRTLRVGYMMNELQFFIVKNGVSQRSEEFFSKGVKFLKSIGSAFVDSFLDILGLLLL